MLSSGTRREPDIGLMNAELQSVNDGATGLRTDAFDLAAGSVLNNTYRIRHVIAEGGMGMVYLATHERLPGLFVVKTPRPAMPHPEQVAARLRQEAHVLASLSHPNIVKVVDFNETPAGTPYLVLEFLDGRDLNDVLHARPLRPWEVAAIVRQIACALSTAHACKIVHRDLKPENVLIVPIIGRDDIVKVIDFGASKLSRSSRTCTGTDLVGTPNYMSPEQAQGHRAQVDARTDQFALAVMTYEMLAQERPFADADPLAVLYRVVHEAAPPLANKLPWKPVAVERVLCRGMEKDPAARYATVREFSEAFDQALHADIGGVPEALRLFAKSGGTSQTQVDSERRRRTSPASVASLTSLVNLANRSNLANVASRPPAEVQSVVSSTVQSDRLSPKGRRRSGRALLVLVAGAVAAGALLLHPQVPPAIASWQAEFGSRVQALIGQTRAKASNNNAARPGVLQPASLDFALGQPSPP